LSSAVAGWYNRAEVMTPMRTPIQFLAAASALMLLASCAQPSPAVGSHDSGRAENMTNDHDDVPPPRDTVSKVMQAKLAHSQAVLEGLALADYAQIESNALALKGISQGSEWLAHESTAYFEYSNEFRSICDDLANHARSRNLQAIAADYSKLTNSCVACHSYLRAERPFQQMPGRVSLLDRQDDR
jgi:hypothetical protein